LPPEEAASRALERYEDRKRFVEPHCIINKIGLIPRENYYILKKEGGFDSYEAYSNDVPRGHPPKLLERSGRHPSGLRHPSVRKSEEEAEGTGKTQTTPAEQVKSRALKPLKPLAERQYRHSLNRKERSYRDKTCRCQSG